MPKGHSEKARKKAETKMMPLKAARVARANRKINNNNDEKDKETSASASLGLESGEKVDNHGDSMITQKRVSKPKKVL